MEVWADVVPNLAIGSLADWVAAGASWATFAVAALALIVAAWGVVVSLVGAAAVAYLGWQANSLASSAVRHELKRSEQEDHMEAKERRMLLVALSVPIGVAAASLVRASALLRRSSHADLANADFRRRLNEMLKAGACDISESIRSRIHLIGEPHASMIVRAQATPRALMAMINIVAEAPDPDITGNAYPAVVSGVATAIRDLTMAQEQIAAAVKEAGIPPAVTDEGAPKAAAAEAK